MSDDDLEAVLRGVGHAPPRPLHAAFVDRRYDLGPLLGEGSFGAVYEAFDRERGEAIALKILRHASSDSLRRFKREFRQLAALRHPSFVRLHDLHGEGERWYFAMERVDGVPFDAWASSEERLRDALAGLARALEALHQLGLVHRDVKPSNVLVEKNGRVVLLDFGLAHTLEESSSTVMAGTPAYVAPEVLAGAPPLPASDWYAVGVMLYEALTGESPFAGSAQEVLARKRTSRPAPVRSRAPLAPPDLAALCDALLDPDPTTRTKGETITRSETRGSSFVGRERELAELEAALSRRPRVVRVVGPSGFGKTALVAELAKRAKARGAHVLVSRCRPRDRIPFVAIDEIVDEIARMLARRPAAQARAIAPRDPGSLVQAFPVLGAISGFEPKRDAGGFRSRIGMALAELLSRWGDGAPWLLVVDDAQWGDADSAAVLGELLRASDVEVGLVLAHRDGARGPFLDAIGGAAPEVSVGALSDDDARRLAERAGARTDVDALVRDANGHALFLLELVRDRARGGSRRSLREILLDRLAAMRPDAARAARLLALAAHPVAASVLREMGVSATALDELRYAELVRFHDAESIRIVHDRVQEIFAETIDAAEARSLHEQLARALADVSPDRAEALAFHLEHAGDLASAADALLRAARHATATRAFAHARLLYDRLLSLRERAAIDDGLDLLLLVEGAEASARAGLATDAAEGFLAASRRATADEALMLRVRAAEQLLTAGHRERGEKILDEQLARLGLSIPSSDAGRVLGVVRDKVGKRLDRLRTRPTSEARLTALWSAFRAALFVEPVRALGLGTCLVREAARPGATPRARLAAAFIESSGEVAPRGPEALARSLERIANAVGDGSDPALLQLHGMAKGTLEHLGLAFQDSVRSFERVVRLGADHGLGHTDEETTSLMLQGSSAWSLGDVDHVRTRVLPLSAELAERDHIVGSMLTGLHGTWLIMLEDGADAASDRLEELGQRWTSRGLELQGWWLDIGRIHFALVRGDGRMAWHLSLPQARRYRERFFLTLMHRLEAQTFLVRAAICLARQGRATPEDLARARRAIAEVASVPSPWTRAHASCLRAGLASVTGDEASAATALRAARSALDDAGMIFMRVLVDDALGTLLGGDEGATLTKSARARLKEWRFDRERSMASTLPGKW